MVGVAVTRLLPWIIIAAGPLIGPERVAAGIHVEKGVLTKDGAPYHGVGANYYSLFSRLLHDPQDTGSLSGLAQLAQQGVPFVRFKCGGFWPADQKLYIDDRAEYFRRLDRVVQCAEQNRIGLIPSLFWYLPTAADIVGEHLNQFANPDSKCRAYIRNYTADVVSRYRGSPAIWGWEFGNEANLLAALPDPSKHRPRVAPERGTPPARTSEDELSFEQLRSAYVEFATTVRKYDQSRMISSGNAMPRASAWHNTHERNWLPDNPAQFTSVLAEQNPDPMDALSVHVYAGTTSPGGVTTIEHAIEVAAKAAAAMGKPLWIGEFPAGGGPEQFARILAAIKANSVGLAAFWVFDLPEQEKSNNVDFQNSRAFVFPLIRRWNLPITPSPRRNLGATMRGRLESPLVRREAHDDVPVGLER